MNVCLLMGRLCEEPELQSTKSGVPVTSFQLAVDRGYKDNSGERVTDFIPCVAWRQTAELVTRHFRKGQRLAAEGALQSRTYTTKDGNKRTVVEMHVQRVHFCESRPVPVSGLSPAETVQEIVDEELPF